MGKNNGTKSFTTTMSKQQSDDLDTMAKEMHLSKNALIVMATASLLANYEAKGAFVLVDLLNPAHRSGTRR